MKKRLIAYFLCTVLVLSATGCRKQAETGNVQNPSEEVEMSASLEEKDTGEVTEESAGEPEEKAESVKEPEPSERAALDNKEEETAPDDTTVQRESVALEEKAAKPEKPDKKAASAGNDTTKKSSQTAGAAEEVKNVPQTSGEKTPESSESPKPTAPAATKPVQSPSKAEQPHTCTWDSGKVTTAATCGSEGVKTYTCTGCGKTRTESIAKTSHNYVTETFPATCTRGVRTVTACSICGDVQSETYSGGPLCHLWEKTYWPEAPTCRNGGYYYQTCARCGEKGESGTDPALPHTQVQTEIRHGNCTEETVLVFTCSSCGIELGRDGHTEPNDHDWQQVSYEERNLITGEMETKTVTACSRCHTPQ